MAAVIAGELSCTRVCSLCQMLVVKWWPRMACTLNAGCLHMQHGTLWTNRLVAVVSDNCNCIGQGQWAREVQSSAVPYPLVVLLVVQPVGRRSSSWTAHMACCHTCATCRCCHALSSL